MEDALREGMIYDKFALDQAQLDALITLGCHHEMQHQELLVTDLLHALSHNPLLPAYTPSQPEAVREAPEQSWTRHEGGLVEIGHDGNGFAYDCEGPRHKVWLEPYRLADRPVTNGEWIAFMEDGGYDNQTLWLMEGWAVREQNGWDSPLYWWRQDDQWWTFTLQGPRPVDLSAPVVHVSYYEADAFARWAGHRLPTRGNGRQRPSTPKSAETFWKAVPSCRLAATPDCGAMSGSGPAAHSRPIRVSGRRKARSVSTTANSW